VTHRLDPSVFQLPIAKIRAGYYTDAYFNHTRQVLLADGQHPNVVMQVFQKNDAYLGGVDEAIAILKQCADTDFANLRVHALHDGDRIEPHETVLTIEGDYAAFAHLETVYLGTLARRTLITTNSAHALQAANGKPIIFMAARHDHFRVQTGDGYAAHVAGKVVGAPISVTSDDQASWWGGKGVGTIPHSLIAAYGGDTVEAARRFAEFAPPGTNVTALVDFDNDSVRTAVEVADALRDKLWGVRLDTAEDLTDAGSTGPGVTPELARNVRRALDEAGHPDVKIVVSGGFDVEKIRRFEELRVPVDAYGVGSALIRGANDFTADIVMVDGAEVHKVGRALRPNSRLEPVG